MAKWKRAESLGAGLGAQTIEQGAIMIESILQERGAKYGAFKDNVEKMAKLKATFSSKESKEVQEILGTLLSLKMARLLYVWDKEYRGQGLKALEREDSYLDLCGYAELIKRNYSTYKMAFETLLLDDENTADLKSFVNYMLFKGV